MSVSPSSSRCRLLKEGYLDVKTPPDSPERILYKAWRRQWVSATAYIPASRGEPHLILLVCRAKDDQPSAKKQVKASRDGLRLFRCRSGSRPLQTWALASGSSLLLYMAGKTEEETQRWMAAIRDGLWPPILAANSLTGTSHDVSLIDDEKSSTAGLLGVYGRLVQTSEDVLSVIHPHWQGTQMRWQLDDILEVCLVRTVGKDDAAGVFHIALRSNIGETITLLFYCNTATTTIEWIRSLLRHMKSDQKPAKSKVDSSLSSIQSDKTNFTSEISSQYSIVQKPKAAEKLNSALQTENDDLQGQVKLLGTISLNIPDGFLDASMSSSMFRQKNIDDKSPNSTRDEPSVNGQGQSEDSDDSSSDIYENLYENLDTTKITRSNTVYEEVEDGSEEYVPPMPPSLPKRQPAALQVPGLKPQEPDATLRLQKLRESVTEALKQAEETPGLAGGNANLQREKNSQKRKKTKESKALVKPEGLHSSPKLGTKLSAVDQSGSSGNLKRVVSDSEIKKASNDGSDLPLLPFNCRRDSDTTHKKEPRQEKQNHLPLQDILKNLKVGLARGNVAGRETSQESKVSQNAGSNAKKSTTSDSEETEAQYLDMS